MPAFKISTPIIVSKHNEWSAYWFYIPLKGCLTSSELFDHSKQRWLLQRVCLVCADMLCPAITGGVCSGSLQANQKSPWGTKPKAYPLCMGNNEKAPFKCSVGGTASWTLTGWLSSREITLIHTQKLHRDAEESSVLCLSISICYTWRNYNFHYPIDPVISREKNIARNFLWATFFPPFKLWDYAGDNFYFSLKF